MLSAGWQHAPRAAKARRSVNGREIDCQRILPTLRTMIALNASKAGLTPSETASRRFSRLRYGSNGALMTE